MKCNAQNRRTAAKVVDGKVQRKNRKGLTSLAATVIDRESPGHGFVHVVSKKDVLAFIDLIPDWPKLSQRLERVIMRAPDSADACYYFYPTNRTGAIELYAWNEELWVELPMPYFDAHRQIWDRLGVSYDEGSDEVTCRFTKPQARAFMLLHVFVHELGHHHDRMNRKHRDSSSGETYAERFANDRFDQLLPRYIEVFGDPSAGG